MNAHLPKFKAWDATYGYGRVGREIEGEQPTLPACKLFLPPCMPNVKIYAFLLYLLTAALREKLVILGW